MYKNILNRPEISPKPYLKIDVCSIRFYIRWCFSFEEDSEILSRYHKVDTLVHPGIYNER